MTFAGVGKGSVELVLAFFLIVLSVLYFLELVVSAYLLGTAALFKPQAELRKLACLRLTKAAYQAHLRLKRVLLFGKHSFFFANLLSNRLEAELLVEARWAMVVFANRTRLFLRPAWLLKYRILALIKAVHRPKG